MDFPHTKYEVSNHNHFSKVLLLLILKGWFIYKALQPAGQSSSSVRAGYAGGRVHTDTTPASLSHPSWALAGLDR